MDRSLYYCRSRALQWFAIFVVDAIDVGAFRGVSWPHNAYRWTFDDRWVEYFNQKPVASEEITGFRCTLDSLFDN